MIKEITCLELKETMSDYRLIDVRRSEEFVGELKHIEGAQLATLGPELEKIIQSHSPDSKPIVFICRSGQRSMNACLLAYEYGLENCYNLIGGMIKWNELALPVV